MRDNPEGGELDPADDVHKRCKKNSPSVLSCIDKRTKEGCDRGSEVGTVHSGKDGEGPAPLWKPGIWQKREYMKLPGKWAGDMGEEECRSSFGKQVCQFVTGKSSAIGDPLEA